MAACTERSGLVLSADDPPTPAPTGARALT